MQELRSELSANLLSLLFRFAFFLEPISPRFISFALRQRLGDWKKKGLIERYVTKTRRVGKFHYKIVVDLDFTPQQAKRMMRGILFRAFNWNRR